MAPPEWSSAPRQEWIAALPPGAVVSATGDQGTGEAPLLVGAPLALAFALALSLSGIIVIAATAAYTASLGGAPLSIGPLGTYLMLIAALVLTVVVTALIASRTALHRPR